MIRKARIEDIKQLQALINGFAKRNLMLGRSLNELYEHLRDFWVMVKKDKVIACAALHISWDDLAEIKSLAVAKPHQHKGTGTALVGACLKEARQLGARRVFVLTYQPAYFRQFGFTQVTHADLPHKVWAECINCCKFPHCQEIALIKNLAK